MTSRPVTPATASDRLRAPREDGAVLSRPPLTQGVQLARDNKLALDQNVTLIAGRPLSEFRKWARENCLAAAVQWMSGQLNIEAVARPDRLLFVTGHQPQLNHAGVWMKNVAVGRLAECCGGQSLNLIVDNDLAGPPVLRTPGGTPEEPVFTEIPFDDLQTAQPWEELSVRNPELLQTFASRVEDQMRPWGIHPMLGPAWSAALETLDRSDRLATLLSSARIWQERQWHIHNLELPVSELCRTDAFAAFVAHLCRNFERLFADYNQAVHDYRRTYRVRNHRHPVPDLEQQEDRFELPFWYWNPGEHDRRRVFARRTEQGIELSAGDQVLTLVPADSNDFSQISAVQQTGRLRTRALTTTLFARICLSDLFIHGIGGARYDEITDQIIRSFFQISAPAFVTLTATLHLPIKQASPASQSVAELKEQLRHLHYDGAQSELDDRSSSLRIRRGELIHAAQEDRVAGHPRSVRRARRGERRRRHLELARIRKELQEIAAPMIAQKELELSQAQEKFRADSVLKSREFAAALFPEATVRGLVEDLRRQICGRA
ncbi:hypothetical protein SH661x_002168 [Planctomicrobium sp. SH661]|uniref:hypothetical protein n=1 Tax=Planctomicrobium sp. SH661 TaxID=3448124 RepID=UPI003F5CAA41